MPCCHCRSLLPQAQAALPSLPPAALANLAWAYAHMASPMEAYQIVPAASARILDECVQHPPAPVLARACIACTSLQHDAQMLSASPSAGAAEKMQLDEWVQRLAGLALLFGKQLASVDRLAAHLEPGLAAKLHKAMPELLAA